MMLLASGVNFGFRRSVPHMLGIGIGFMVLLLATGLGLGQLLERFPVIYTTLKYVGAAYMLWMVQKVFFGTVTHQENLGLKDLSLREIAAAVPLLALIGIMGLRPQPVLDLLNPSTERFLARANYASGKTDAGTEDQKVRVQVRSLPPKAAFAAAPTAMPRFLPTGRVLPAAGLNPQTP
jgi:NADH-quinone oxidoreductase subunit M